MKALADAALGATVAVRTPTLYIMLLQFSALYRYYTTPLFIESLSIHITDQIHDFNLIRN
jgi:hypothetical protein